jgi:hypothetical protein
MRKQWNYLASLFVLLQPSNKGDCTTKIKAILITHFNWKTYFMITLWSKLKTKPIFLLKKYTLSFLELVTLFALKPMLEQKKKYLSISDTLVTSKLLHMELVKSFGFLLGSCFHQRLEKSN